MEDERRHRIFRDKILTALVVTVPCFVLWNDIDQGQVYGLYLGAFVYAALGILLLNRILGLFLLFVAGWFAYWISGHFVQQIHAGAVVAGIDALLFMICAMIIYEGIVKSEIEDETWFNVICGMALFQAVLGISQYQGFDPVGTAMSQVVDIGYGGFDPKTPAGSLANTNYMGAFLAVSLSFFFRGKWRLAIPVIVYTLIIANCRTANIAVLTVATFYGLRYGSRLTKSLARRVRWEAFALVILAFAFVVYLMAMQNFASFMDRYNEYWRAPLAVWLGSTKTFLFGVGPGITARANNYLHSEPVALAWNFGALGLVFMTAYIGTTIWKLSRTEGNSNIICAIIIAAIDMQANHLLHVPSTGLLMIIVAAVAERRCKGISVAAALKPVWARIWRYRPIFVPVPSSGPGSIFTSNIGHD